MTLDYAQHSFHGETPIIHPEVPTPPARQPWQPAPIASSVIAHGVSGWTLNGPVIRVQISNHGTDPIRLSYVADDYHAKTSDGRVVVLDKEFMHYPSVLQPGAEGVVKLLVPDGVAPGRIARILATLDSGQLPIIIEAVAPVRREPPPGRAQQATSPGEVAESQPTPTLLLPSTPSPPPMTSPRVPLSPPTAANSASSQPTRVAALVEFHHQPGSAIQADVRWNEHGTIVRLGHDQQQAFQLLPGQHLLHVTLRQPSLAETTAHLPILAMAGVPIRVGLQATTDQVHPQLNVRVWQGEQAILNRTFAPTAAPH